MMRAADMKGKEAANMFANVSINEGNSHNIIDRPIGYTNAWKVKA